MGRFLRILCHQSPDRCLKINDKPMPICARCTGFYSGILIGAIFNFFNRAIVDLQWWMILLIVAVGLAPMAMDGFTQLWGWRESSNSLRLITGFIAGFTCGIIIIYLGVSIVMMVF